jgi:hypothetical protein
MKWPPEFEYLSGCFHQDIYVVTQHPTEIPDYIAGSLLPQHRLVLKPYLRHIVSPQVDDAQLLDIWNASSPGMYFVKGADVRKLLTHILQLIS